MTLYQTTKPLQSHHKHLMRSRRFPMNKNIAEENGSSFSTSCTNAARPDRCFLMSIGARCRYIRPAVCSGRSMISSLHQRLKPRGLRQIRALDHPAAAMVQSASAHDTACRRRDPNRHKPTRAFGLPGHDRERCLWPTPLPPQLGTDVVQALGVQSLRSAVLRQRQSSRLRLTKMDQVSPLSSGQLAMCRCHRALRPRPIAASTASTDHFMTGSTWFLEPLQYDDGSPLGCFENPSAKDLTAAREKIARSWVMEGGEK